MSVLYNEMINIALMTCHQTLCQYMSSCDNKYHNLMYWVDILANLTLVGADLWIYLFSGSDDIEPVIVDRNVQRKLFLLWMSSLFG